MSVQASAEESLHLHCTCTMRYFETKFPPKEPQPHHFQRPSKLGHPDHPSWTQLHATFPSPKMSCTMEQAMKVLISFLMLRSLSNVGYKVSKVITTSPTSWHLFKVCLTCFLTYLCLHPFIMVPHLVWLLHLLLRSWGFSFIRIKLTSDFSVVGGSCLKSWAVFSPTLEWNGEENVLHMKGLQPA